MSKLLNLEGGPLCLVEWRSVRGVNDKINFGESGEAAAGGFLICGGVMYNPFITQAIEKQEAWSERR